MSSSEASLIRGTCGSLLIGALVAMAFYGITTLQTYFYFLTFPKDGFVTRTLVPLIWIIDTLHIIFMCHSVYTYLIINYGNPNVIAYGNWSLFASIGANLLMVCTVQSCFAYRIFKLCKPKKRWWVGGYIGCLIFVHFVFGVATFVFLFLKKRFDLIQHLLAVIVPLTVFIVVSDVTIAASLCILLWGNRSGFSDTDTAINKLVIFLINRCILTSAVAITEAILFMALPNTLHAFAIDFTLGKRGSLSVSDTEKWADHQHHGVYANSLLAVLNSRARLRQPIEEFKSTEMSTRFVVASRIGDHHMHVEVQSPESVKAASVVREGVKEWP